MMDRVGGQKMEILSGGSKPSCVDDRFQTNGKPTWWDLNTIFEILKYAG